MLEKGIYRDWKVTDLQPGCEDGNEQGVPAANLVRENSKQHAANSKAQHEAGGSHGHPDLRYFKVLRLESLKSLDDLA